MLSSFCRPDNRRSIKCMTKYATTDEFVMPSIHYITHEMKSARLSGVENEMESGIGDSDVGRI